MRIVLFYSEVESFNCFTNLLETELHTLGHETFILDLKNLLAEGPISLHIFQNLLLKRWTQLSALTVLEPGKIY